MPIETIIVLTAITAAFGFFATIVILGDLTSGGN